MSEKSSYADRLRATKNTIKPEPISAENLAKYDQVLPALGRAMEVEHRFSTLLAEAETAGRYDLVELLEPSLRAFDAAIEKNDQAVIDATIAEFLRDLKEVESLKAGEVAAALAKERKEGKAFSAKTVEVWYEAGGTRLVTGIRGGGEPRYGHVISGGNGTFGIALPSHLVLTVDVDGKQYDAWIENPVRRGMGQHRLTEKLRNAITATMPPEIRVMMKKGRYGKEYVNAVEEDFEAWTQAAKEKLAEKPKKAR